MQLLLIIVLQLLHIVGVLGLTVYGGNALWLTWQRLRFHRPTSPLRPPLARPWPRVTIQLPIYNEQHVAERLIDACARLEYPTEALEIQVLDDSTDKTQTLVKRRVRYWQGKGLRITAIHRSDRRGYKAGALAHAFARVNSELIAIFDADFVPPRDFLQRTVPLFLQPGGDRLGFVQTRWGHLNEHYSPLTRAQALALDGHFVVEQAGRQTAGYPFGFNGSAGLWRRDCIADPAVGGWQADTLCEDLDLSYRAQLAGWRARYVDEVVAPAEIPPQLIAFRRQQFRWAKGSVQTLRKLYRRVWQSGWPRTARLAGLIHLGGYLIHPLLLIMLLVALPLMLLGIDPAPQLTLFSLASLGPPLLYAVGQRTLHPQDWWRRWAYLPVLALLGMGLSLNNTVAVWQGFFQPGGQFLRTPKFRVESSGDVWQRSNYRLPLDLIWLGEVTLFCYALLTVAVALLHDKPWSIPFMLLYAGGYGLMVGVSAWQARRATRPVAPPQPPSGTLGPVAVGNETNVRNIVK
jgi:cellulose synthase/poly-beta-1,6-N-acetylglucosamine synthase-like glycosyltransferase